MLPAQRSRLEYLESQQGGSLRVSEETEEGESDKVCFQIKIKLSLLQVENNFPNLLKGFYQFQDRRRPTVQPSLCIITFA